MLYRLLKILMTVALRFFYKHLHVAGLEHVPDKGPVILIANHHASLMDAALIGIIMKRPVYFFTRGDVFINPFVNKLLSWMHMLPVHNHEKGRGTLQDNKGSFSKAQRVLLKGGVIVFFPESNSHIQRQLLPFRKGVFRLAFQTAHIANFSFDIPMVPIGITYEHPKHSGTEVLIEVGPPLSILPYKEMYLQNSASALLHICKEAYERMRRLVLHINDARLFSLAEILLTINRNSHYFHRKNGWYINSGKQLESEQAICYKINEQDTHQLKSLHEKSENYQATLASLKLNDSTVAHSFRHSAFSGVLVFLLSPLFLIGCLLNGLPILLSRKIVDKKVSRIDFYSWLYVTISVVLYAGWIFLLAGIMGVCFGWMYGLLSLTATLFFGIFVVYYKPRWNKNIQYKRMKNVPVEQVHQLKRLRKEISSII
jgi:1-acyl-sn-glycerol-3-phosphate acyltransferase